MDRLDGLAGGARGEGGRDVSLGVLLTGQGGIILTDGDASGYMGCVIPGVTDGCTTRLEGNTLPDVSMTRTESQSGKSC